jgi:hypothetical protein
MLIFCRHLADFGQVAWRQYTDSQMAFCRYLADIFSGTFVDSLHAFCRLFTEVLKAFCRLFCRQFARSSDTSQVDSNKNLQLMD